MFLLHRYPFFQQTNCFPLSSSFFLYSPYAFSCFLSSPFYFTCNFYSKNFFSELKEKETPLFQEKGNFSPNIIDYIRMKNAIYNMALKKMVTEFDENAFVSICYKIVNFKNFNEEEYEQKIGELLLILKESLEKIQNLITIVTLLKYFKSIKNYSDVEKFNLTLQMLSLRGLSILHKNNIFTDDGILLYSFTFYLVENEEKLCIPPDEKLNLVNYILKHWQLFGYELFYKTLRCISKSSFYNPILAPKINKILKFALKDRKFLIESNFLELFNTIGNLPISTSAITKRRLIKLLKSFEERKYETQTEAQAFIETLKKKYEIHEKMI